MSHIDESGDRIELAGAAPLESILRTEELHRRPSRPPDHGNENRALVALVGVLADAPETVLQTLADKVLETMHADSAGLSLLTKDKERFYWAAISGAWGPHIGGGTPRNFGPCGDVLDCNTPMLFSHWERRYPYLGAAVPLADEGLLVPFYVNGEAVGTIWAISHDASRHFDGEDLRLLQSLGRFASAAYQAVGSIEHLKAEIVARERAQAELRGIAARLEMEILARTAALRRSEAFLAEAQRLSETGSFCWRVCTDEITWSDQLYRIFELERGVPVTLELIGSRVHPEDLPSFNESIERARITGSDFEYEHRLQMRDRSIKYLHLVAHASRDRDGRLEYTGAVRDVTQGRVAEEALARARSELAHVARVMTFGALTATIAHEVNQPIGAVRNNANAALRLLAQDPPALAEVREALECVVSDTYRACSIIERIRDHIKKAPARKAKVDLNRAIDEVIALVRAELLANRVSIRTQWAEGLPGITVDRIQLQQVVVNLIMNAIEAMVGADDDGRLLAITTEAAAPDNVLVAVGDSGPGIEAHDRERVFESFYTTKASGMGIGLSICRSIIAAHGGRLWVDPNQPHGALFRFTLPMRA